MTTTTTSRSVPHDGEGPARPSRTSAPSASNADEDLHQLVKQHRGLAVHIAHQFFRHRPEHGDEYIAAALLGLVEAAASSMPTLVHGQPGPDYTYSGMS